MLMKFIRDIIQGAKDLPGYGPHPGNGMVVLLIILGGIAGLHGGWEGFIGGAAFMALFMVPMWAIGCIDRARSYQRRNKEKTDE
jgi:hypothetical protein